ncbi:adhesion G-protein coupled receptor D1-like [Actinia tenebrosa]|uniref:Adhesion G-protein coupled receptor D1-like n=1 Tax=Actinia tenebrosa TaxID=6105 RepID=A0A6P8IGW8_ACTTE|nr:adhesion G-protein coupled receptor D1-like [Actinia tenebrosa]
MKMKNLDSSCRNTTNVLIDNLHKQSRKEMKSQDLITAVYAIDVIAAMGKHKNFMDKKNGEKIVSTTSNLLEPRNSKSWQQLREGKNAHIPKTLVRAMDIFGRIIANTSLTNTTIIIGRNLAIEAKKIEPNTEFPLDGVNFTYNESSISLPAEIFDTSEQSIVVNIIYLTLGDILQLPLNYTDLNRKRMNAVNVSTTTISSTVTPRKEIKTSGVKIILKNKRSFPELNDSSSRICVSWNPESSYGAWSDYGCQLVPGESDSEKTTCVCSHLTLFATFMDPHQIPLSSNDRFILEFISTIGCAISLFSIALTMAVILPNWRRLKSPRIEVLVNICASIGIVCFLVLVEHPARQNKVMCKAMAVLLHYFLLTAFAWMFCEGILLHMVLIKVDMTGATRYSKKHLYLIGWGFPLLIVLISLWATELKGYGDSPYVCWLSVKNGVTWAFVAPALVVIGANLMVLMKIIARLKNLQKIRNNSLRKQVATGTRAIAATMPLLGVTWLFGMLTFHTNLTVFKYLFTICNSLQGVFIFIFHCLLDRQVRKVFKSSLRRSKRRTGPQPPVIQMKPYKPYIINTPQEPNRHKERRKACINNVGIF